MIENLISESYHAFQIVPVAIGQILIQKGVVVHCSDAFTTFQVEGATQDIKNFGTELTTIENGGTVSVLITHSPKDETDGIVVVSTCEISNLAETPDSNTKTVVKIGSVVWNGESAEIDQELRSDIFCAIYGTGNEQNP